MCKNDPGPRCSHDMRKKVDTRTLRTQEALDRHGADSVKYAVAKAKLEQAQREFDATPDGIEALAMRAHRFPNEVNERALLVAQRTREMQVNALEEVENGRVDSIAVLAGGINGFYGHEEIFSVLQASREYQEAQAMKQLGAPLDPVQPIAYETVLGNLEKRIRVNQGYLTPAQEAALDKLYQMPPCDPANLAAYDAIQQALDRSQKSLRGEIARVANIQNVSPKIAEAYYEAYRQQYIDSYADLPRKARPNPPKEWIRGELQLSGYTRDPATAFAPRDPASVYAIYRMRSDEAAIPDFLKINRSIVAVDLETASPRPAVYRGDAQEAMKPEHGRIIEVGIAAYTPRGKAVATFSQLIRPERTFLQEHGTGAEEIHKIGIKDLRNAPAWGQVKDAVARRIEGRLLIAQNASFEQNWLNWHLDGFQASQTPFVDTLDMSRKHLDLPNHRLPTICGFMGVTYGTGHRAGHDAEVTGQAYFQMKRYIRRTWMADDARRSAPVIEELPLGSRWDGWRPIFKTRAVTKKA